MSCAVCGLKHGHKMSCRPDNRRDVERNTIDDSLEFYFSHVETINVEVKSAPVDKLAVLAKLRNVIFDYHGPGVRGFWTYQMIHNNQGELERVIGRVYLSRMWEKQEWEEH